VESQAQFNSKLNSRKRRALSNDLTSYNTTHELRRIILHFVKPTTEDAKHILNPSKLILSNSTQ